MKKPKKLKILKKACGTYDFCRVFFKQSDFYQYFYILDYSNALFFGAAEDDFLIDGFEINRISDIKKIELKDDECVKINRTLKLLDGIIKPSIDLTSWKTIFKSISRMDFWIIIENRNTNDFYIGKIKKVKKHSVVIKHFDAFGVWQKKIHIPYSEISSVRFGDRYSTNWKKYLKNKMPYG